MHISLTFSKCQLLLRPSRHCAGGDRSDRLIHEVNNVTMGFIRRAKSRFGGGKRRAFAFGEGGTFGERNHGNQESHGHWGSNDSLGEQLESEDQFEIAVQLKVRSPVGILRNSSSLSRRNLDEQSTASSITMESDLCVPAKQQQANVKTIETPPRHQERDSKNCRDYASCCGYSTATGETEDSNSLVDGSDNKSSRTKPQTNSSWFLCGGPKEIPQYVEDDEIPHPSYLAVKPLRRDTSLFDTLEEEVEEEEPDESDEPDDYTLTADTQVAIAESFEEIASVASKYSNLEKQRSFRLPKELIRGLSKVRKSRSFRRLASFRKGKSKNKQLQQYVVEP